MRKTPLKNGTKTLRRTPFKRKSPLLPKKSTLTPSRLKQTKLRRIGKVGKANIAARGAIAQIAEEKNLTRCEIGFAGCTETWPLAPAHRHKRAWYKGDVKKLADYKQWVAACMHCHDTIEHNATLTEETFMKLRGPE